MLAAVCATGGSAQPAPMLDAKQTVARKTLQEYAWCTVRREPALAHSYALMKSGEQLPLAEYQRLFDGNCLRPFSSQLQMRVWQSRAALAEALLVRDDRLRQVTNFAQVGALDWSVVTPTAVPGQAIDPATLARVAAEEADNQRVSRLGECVVRHDPAASMAILRTEIDSGAERKRFGALAPTIASCVQQGQTRTFNRTNLRAAMALAHYRLAVAATAQGKV